MRRIEEFSLQNMHADPPRDRSNKCRRGNRENPCPDDIARYPQRTADILCDAPTPTMAPVMVCVVETGTPIAVAMNSVMAPPVSAQKPPTGLSLVIFWPMVLTMRHPPNKVPRLIAQ